MKQSIKYQYALDEENHIIDISMINKEHRIHSNYHCLSCGRELIAKLGEIKQKHFAHKFDTEGFPCNNETYLGSAGHASSLYVAFQIVFI